MVRKQELPPLIISAALTGGLHGKEANPALPETPEEQAQAAYECYKAGASIVHIHARDPATGYANPSTNPEHYYKINKLIREKCPDIIINNTTGGGLGLSTEQRIRSLEANPEVASLNMGPLAWMTVLKKREPPLTGRPNDVYMDTIWPPTFTWKETELFAQRMLEKNIKPELEVYHQGQFQLVYNLIDKGLIKPPYLIQFVMGAPSAVIPTAHNLISMLYHVPPNSVVSVIGIGPFQLHLTTIAIAMGLHARVGLEDNVYYRRGELAKSNAQLVERTARIARELNREIATPAQAREMLGIPKEPKLYD
ncbi:MAG: 3-keto-5-aminohexanoate cleavage protein [Candidatus Caldarchaeum sp.]|nr:3-keto-5-aminohexanoate cleavage protein [Candidatus Caldarchaeum sp.]MDW7977900.1 3-keto-5-aminohexanoate cleavage protein [Candidatus Caldarchaeum sp.]